jgi:hypothetical protein
MNANKYAYTSSTDGNILGVSTPQAFMENHLGQLKPTLKYKLDKIADLFECEVLNDKEAFNACQKAIQQHSRAQCSGQSISSIVGEI